MATLSVPEVSRLCEAIVLAQLDRELPSREPLSIGSRARTHLFWLEARRISRGPSAGDERTDDAQNGGQDKSRGSLGPVQKLEELAHCGQPMDRRRQVKETILPLSRPCASSWPHAPRYDRANAYLDARASSHRRRFASGACALGRPAFLRRLRVPSGFSRCAAASSFSYKKLPQRGTSDT